MKTKGYIKIKKRSKSKKYSNFHCNCIYRIKTCKNDLSEKKLNASRNL